MRQGIFEHATYEERGQRFDVSAHAPLDFVHAARIASEWPDLDCILQTGKLEWGKPGEASVWVPVRLWWFTVEGWWGLPDGRQVKRVQVKAPVYDLARVQLAGAAICDPGLQHEACIVIQDAVQPDVLRRIGEGMLRRALTADADAAREAKAGAMEMPWHVRKAMADAAPVTVRSERIAAERSVDFDLEYRRKRRYAMAHEFIRLGSQSGAA